MEGMNFSMNASDLNETIPGALALVELETYKDKRDTSHSFS